MSEEPHTGPAEHTENSLSIRLLRHAPRIRTINIFAIIIAIILAVTVFGTNVRILNVEEWSVEANEEYATCMNATYDVRMTSDFLTARARVFTMTGKREYLDEYLTEAFESGKRDNATDILRTASNDPTTSEAIDDALEASNELQRIEMYAMRLIAESLDMRSIPTALAEVELSDSDAALSSKDQREVARAMLFDEEYSSYKATVARSVETCTNNLVAKLRLDTDRAADELHSLLNTSHIVVILLLAIIAFIILTNYFLIVWPMATYSREIENKRALVPFGAAELRYLAESYNQMHDEVQKQTRTLKRNAERDPLTGLFNRGVFDDLLDQDLTDVTLLIVDVDYFKNFNDQYGHEMGDKVLKRVASSLMHEYRTSDYACRIGGDEFAVVMTDTNIGLKNVIARKIGNVVEALRADSGDIPGVTLSIGVAFSSDETVGAQLYRAADEALYQVKRRGRNGFAFYGDEDEGLDANADA